jgi:hypothetical protein
MNRHIVVFPHGFVFVGDLTRTDKQIRLDNSACIRIWGTTSGLGELALHGPTSSTVLDPCGIVVAPSASEVLSIPCSDNTKWPL